MTEVATDPLSSPDQPVATTSAAPRRMSERELLTFVSSLMALMALGIDLMLPAFDDIRTAFDLGENSPRSGQVVTVFFLGLAAAQIAWGPLADRFGRKPVLYSGVGIYLFGAVGSALSPSFGLLLVSRFVWGLGAAGTRVVATSIIRDRFAGSSMARALSQVMAVFMLVPVLAPSIGTAIIAIAPWRSVFWFCVVAALLVSTWGLRLRESLDPAHRRELDVSSTVGGYVEVARTRVTGGYTVAMTFLYGVFTTYLASSELIISEVLDRGAQFPYVFGGVACLFAGSAIINGRVVEAIGLHRVIALAYRAATALVVALIVLSLASSGRPEFWLFMPILGLTLACFMFLMPNLNTAALVPVGHLAGTASALTGAASMAGGAVLGTVVSGFISDSTTPFAIGVGALIGISWLTVLIVRRRSPELTTDTYE